MSMSTYILGVVNKDRLEKAIQARKTLQEFGLEYPDELDDIIEDSIDIPFEKVPDDCEDIFEVDVKRIPKNVEKIRFIVSY